MPKDMTGGYEQFKTGVVFKHARESAGLTQGWHDDKHSLLPWWEYFLGVMLLSAYKEFEQRVGLVSTVKGAKTATVLDAVRSMKGEFSVKDVQERCPAVGIDLIRRILRQEREANRLECLGRGPDARWKNK